MPDRQEMIDKLTRQELEWLLGDWQPTMPGIESNSNMAVKFFACGGFTTWSDERLKAKFEMHFDLEEEENA